MNSFDERLSMIELQPHAHDSLPQPAQIGESAVRALLGCRPHRHAGGIARSRRSLTPEQRIERHLAAIGNGDPVEGDPLPPIP